MRNHPLPPPRRRVRDPERRPRWRYADHYCAHLTEDDLPWSFFKELHDLWTLDQRRWNWLRRRMRSALPVRERRAVELHYLEGLNYTQCARRLNVHPATVSRSIHRAINKLRQEAKTHPHLWPEKP